jgi:DNA-binding MarR family transcriptional regulator
MNTPNINQTKGLDSIPLTNILQDNRVIKYMQEREREISRKEAKKLKRYHSQIKTCHSWLIALHYIAISKLQRDYNITKPGFMVLMGAYLLKRTGNNGFRSRKLSSTLLSWQYNKVYRHLHVLSNKGYIRSEKNQHSRLNTFWITDDGIRVIRAFSQHYWQVFYKVSEELGDFSPPAGSVFLNDHVL